MILLNALCIVPTQCVFIARNPYSAYMMSKSNGVNPDAPTSEVESHRANEITRGVSENNNQWRLLFEMQNQQMHALIQTKIPASE